MSVDSKEGIINSVSRGYLEDVISGVNKRTPTDIYSRKDDEFKQYIRTKFSRTDLMSIWQGYVLSKDPRVLARKIRGPSPKALIDTYTSRYSDRYFQREVRIADSVCDIVSFSESSGLVATEVKSGRDDLRSAKTQCENYDVIASEVEVLTVTDHRSRALSVLPTWVGVTICTDSELDCVREPNSRPSPKARILEEMTVKQLTHVLSHIGESTTGKKDDLMEKAKGSMSSLNRELLMETFLSS